MKRSKFISEKPKPTMSWGEEGQAVTHKQDGGHFWLHEKAVDGWVIKSFTGSSFYKYSFEDMAKKFTEPAWYG